jgi:hypothetical protein
MKKEADKSEDSEMRSEYVFSQGVRGKYTRRYSQVTNVVVLDPDLVKVFPNSQAVNNSLRALASIIHSHEKAAK